MIRYSVYATYGRNQTRYFIEVCEWEQRWKYYRAKLYHWYDMHIPLKVPGWKRLMKLTPWWQYNGPDEFLVGQHRLMAWSINQDFRCYKYSEAYKTRIGKFEVDKETYDRYSRGVV